jgi:hypothetical protein
MTTNSTLRSTALGLFIILLLAGCTSQPQARTLAATINRDCGPADGPAFTVSVPYEAGRKVVISIWQAPDIAGPKTFTLTDPTDQTGSATLFTGADAWQPLSGTVTFRGVNTGRPVEGTFRLRTASGEALEAGFMAEWTELPAYCG